MSTAHDAPMHLSATLANGDVPYWNDTSKLWLPSSVLGALLAAGVAVGSTASELDQAADLSAVGMLLRCKKLSISSAPSGAEQDTGYDLIAKGLLLDVLLDVTAAEVTGGTKTLNVGLLSSESGGDADGFVAGLSVASTGLKRPGVSIIAGGTETYVGSWTRGVLLAPHPKAGTNNAGDTGIYIEQPHLTGSVTAKSVSFTAGSNDWVEFRGDLYLIYAEIG